MPNEKEQNKETTPPTLVIITHPKFREGYYAGRQQYFRGREILTDKELVECLFALFNEEKFRQGEEPDGHTYYTAATLCGQVSGPFLPIQPHEDNTGELQQAFLNKITQMYGEAGPSLAETIDAFWLLQDKLATKLDADMFKQMLHRGAEKNAL